VHSGLAQLLASPRRQGHVCAVSHMAIAFAQARQFHEGSLTNRVDPPIGTDSTRAIVAEPHLLCRPSSKVARRA